MVSEDDSREMGEAAAAPDADTDVDVAVAPTEEAHAAEAQELHASNGADAAEDSGAVAVTAQVPAELPGSLHAADPAVEDSPAAPCGGEHGSAAASAGEGSVQINATIGDASHAVQIGVDGRKGGSGEVPLDRSMEAEPTPVVPVTDAGLPRGADTVTVTSAPSAVEPPPQQIPQRKAPQEQRLAAVLHREGTPSATSMSPYATFTNVDGLYDLPEEERIAIAAASLTPSTGLAVFRRGHENSHVNRMDIGSYSRYLLSTDHMSPIVLEDTFHGNRPTVGPVPRNTLKGFSRHHISHTSTDDGIAARAESELRRSPRSAAASTSPTRHTHLSTRSPLSAARSQMSDTFNGTATSSTNLRRERDMLDEANLSELNLLRRQRRRDPRRGKTAEEQHDYVFYNHNSKGFYVPHDPAPGTITLQYNHLYSFGDGTRFAAIAPRSAGDNGSATTALHRRHPHGAPPRSFAETRGSVFPFTASQRQYSLLNGSITYNGTAHRRTRMAGPARAASSSSGQVDQQHAATQKSSSSLRTAKSLDLGRLHVTQCPHPRTIEEVMADQPQRYLCGAAGPRGALVQDIERDIEVGKLQWEEVPPAIRKAMVSTETAGTAVEQCGQSVPAAGLPASSTLSASGHRSHHAGSLATAPNALESVMGQMRAVPAITVASGSAPGARGSAAAKTMTTAPPSPTAERARERSPAQINCSAATAVVRMPVGSVAAAAALPAISRLNYTPQPTLRSNPSAFV
ncbi:hypothetical protein LSCM1_05899 [Leishmania martiniquensis]|uniref:Uncharacterized protein n=1 Tax=Leishmania martiniquensis TaxID=1580590 RepID=A0A836HWA3_9TRYP|nr:hypothetical protein LSCM1_05899 [Leishmania martiniquensis]